MPGLIRTFGEVLRETRRNLYYIKFHQAQSFGRVTRTADPHWVDNIPGRRDIFAWFKRECPEVELENIVTDGVLEGYSGEYVRVGFDKKSLAKYVAAWENPDCSSKDPRWICYCYQYRTYLKNAAKFREIHKGRQNYNDE